MKYVLSLPCFLIYAALCGNAAAQPQPDSRIGEILNDLSSTRSFVEVAISPDGKRVAWVDGSKTTIFVKDLASSRPPARIGEGRHIAWSPDGARIAFLSTDAQPQLYTAPANGGRSKRLTSLTGYLTDPKWSPDGTRIAFLFAENAPGGGGPLEAEPVETGVIGTEIHNQRLSILESGSGPVRQVSPADLNIYEYDWSPDGRQFALSAAPGPGDNNWWVAQLFTMSSDTGKMTAIFKPETQIAMPRWSPDGASIAIIQGLMSDEGFTGGEVFTIPAAGGKAVNRTPGRKSSPSSIAWISPAKILMTEFTGGSTAVSTLDVPSGQTERLWQGDENLHAAGNFGNFSVSRDGKTAAAIRSDWQHPPEIWAGAIGDWKPVTAENSGQRPQWGETKNIQWVSDGFPVQGWLLYPRGFNPANRYPMVVSVHGGPAYLNFPHWPGSNFDLSILSALGYFVFFPNPRGSYGQGEAFTQANVKDFGAGDLRDILAGVDTVIKSAPVDAHRIGISGWSYGGYMTMWAVTQTGRFKAAVAGAGLSDWLSYYGENSIDQWMLPYFGASVYDDPAVYAKSSPMTFIKNVKTPTLVVVGERDGECPMPQSYEFWHALRTFGVPTELVVYPGEGHMFRAADHRRDVMERTAQWFEKYLH